MNSKKKNKQEEQRQDELLDALSELMHAVLENFNKYKMSPKEAIATLNSLYVNFCDNVIESRREGLTEQDVKIWLVTQVEKIKFVIKNELPIKVNKDEQE